MSSTVITSVTPKSTVGDSSGKLDAQTSAWFTTLCTGLAPVKNLSTTLTGNGGTPDLKTFSSKVSAVGKDLSATAKKLKTQPQPTFPGGADYGSKAVRALDQLGSVFTQLGQKVSKGDVSGISQLGSQINSGPVKELSQLKVSPATASAIANLPACKKVDFGG